MRDDNCSALGDASYDEEKMCVAQAKGVARSTLSAWVLGLSWSLLVLIAVMLGVSLSKGK